MTPLRITGRKSMTDPWRILLLSLGAWAVALLLGWLFG